MLEKLCRTLHTSHYILRKLSVHKPKSVWTYLYHTVCYWSETNNEVRVKYLTSAIFGHAKAVNVVKEMLTTLEELSISLKLMLSLGMDGPSVNKSILNKVNKIKKEKGFPELVSCSTSCLIHVCHNSFRKGVLKYGFRADELCMNLVYFFIKIHAGKQICLKLSNTLVNNYSILTDSIEMLELDSSFPSIKSYKLWCHARALLLPVSMAGKMSESKLIWLFFQPSSSIWILVFFTAR